MDKTIFNKSIVGFKPFKGLKTKQGEKFNDMQYFEFLGRKCIEMDNQNTNKNYPTNYGNFDKDCVQLAKEVVKAIDNGENEMDIKKYIINSINLEA